MRREYKKPAPVITPASLNRALRKYNQPTINIGEILQPGETIDQWMQEFKAANRGGYLLHDTNNGARTNDYCLLYGSSKQAVENQNIINIFDALRDRTKPTIVSPSAFLKALQNRHLG